MPDCIEFTIYVAEEAAKDMLIAQLAEAGATGFEEQRDFLRAFLTIGTDDHRGVEGIIKAKGIKYSKSIIQDRNWNALCEADFQPVTVDNFCSVRAHFHQPNLQVSHDIVITPKMSFGTGHHATTYLMIQAMEAITFTNTNVFDFGTGTGVLAILAEKCGARQVLAIDNDDWSINNAIENFNFNNCHNILIRNADSISGKFLYDVVLANINRNVILQQLVKFQQHLVKNGVVLLSGLLQGDEPAIVVEAARCGLVIRQKTEMSGWICLSMANA